MEQTRMILKQVLAAVMLALVVLVGTGSPAAAADAAPEKNITLTIGDGDMKVDDKIVPIDGAVPVNNSGRVYIPLRAVAESFGADVEYDDATRDITITSGKTTIIMNTQASIYTVNGELKWMDMAPYVNEGSRTMVPVRFVSTALGYDIETTTGANGAVTSIILTNKQAK